MAKENPITMILRESSKRAVIICRPLANTNAALKNRAAPTTGVGIVTTAMAAAGIKDRSAKIPPIA
jgi:hypothetical protein